MVQIKWLNGGRFRRFELSQLSYAGLVTEMRARVPTFIGEIFYIDDQSDKIVVETDQDLKDMVEYFNQLGEKVVRIQTDDDHQARNDVPVTPLQYVIIPPSEFQHQRESESVDEERVKDQTINKSRKEAEKTRAEEEAKVVDKIEIEDGNLKEAEQKSAESPYSQFDEWANFSVDRLSPESVQTSSIGFEEFLGTSNNSPTNTQAKRRKRGANKISSMIRCMECGRMVSNSLTSLKCHVNQHHLRLPTYSCRHCGLATHQLQKKSIVRHIQTEHPDKSIDAFDYNYPIFARQIHQKIKECFMIRK